MKITARVESPSPVSPPSHHSHSQGNDKQNRNFPLNLPPETASVDPKDKRNDFGKARKIIKIPRNFKSPTSTASNNMRNGIPTNWNMDGTFIERVNSPIFNEAVRSPTPVNLRLESPTPRIQPVQTSPPVRLSDQVRGRSPVRRIQSPLPFRVQSPVSSSSNESKAPSVGEKTSGGQKNKLHSAPKVSNCDELICDADQPVQLEKIIQQIKLDVFSQEVSSNSVISVISGNLSLFPRTSTI